MGTMAYGMWRARYWAVLGFQALLVIVLIAASLGLLQATEVDRGDRHDAADRRRRARCSIFMIKAMARIQMPERPGASRLDPD